MSRRDQHIERARAAWNYRGEHRPNFAETPGPGEESVWDYPRPPALVPESRPVEVRFKGLTLAQSTEAVRVCETGSPPTLYVPPSDVELTYLSPSRRRTFCEWKGKALYLTLETTEATVEDVAWIYPQPFTEFSRIAGWISFYPGKLDCFLGSEAVRPQAGGFYGGWVTHEVIGPFKGAPGTGHW